LQLSPPPTFTPPHTPNVPVPLPRPHQAPEAQPLAPTAQPPATAVAPPPATAPLAPVPAPTAAAPVVQEPLSNPVKRDSNRNARGIDPKTREIIGNLNAYYNNLRSLTADFVQIAPDGRRTTGKLYLDKPGKVRFQYDPPVPVELISDGTTVAVRDRKLATQDVYFASQTPLRYLLSDRIDLSRDANVVSVTRDNDYITVTLEEKQALGGTNFLSILFNTSDYTLRQWTVTDAQGFDTSVAIRNIDTSKRPSASLFRIETTRIVQ
jgi:outer membrane lipoprotein-sorting protein